MTSEQLEDLFEEWSLYGAKQQRAILAEFLEREDEDPDLFEFLKVKLEIEGYWRKIGLL
ncbi:hypothetical protein [Desulforhopalus singaporensis]|uniref:Uncharacterized protein n=1 Tax=Desulforhopalus singaporensis TaxID=91360 RepID=A0A1H0UV69_9BACT|nr:hypothetical protein [Desulforhopalus singaporensis]SDP70053.1 hypothetical protein SAMN05660330_03741 [Desulforhopalus singaporensis]